MMHFQRWSALKYYNFELKKIFNINRKAEGKMNKIIAVILMMCTCEAFAEERELLMSGKAQYGGFGGPVVKLTRITDKTKALIGGQGAVVINHHFYVGGGGGGTARDIGDGYSSYSYGGILFGTFINPHKALHYFTELGLYAGNLSFGSGQMNMGGNMENSAENFYIAEPQLGLAINLTEHSKALIGVAYKFVGAVDRDELSNNDLGGFTLNASIIFGVF